MIVNLISVLWSRLACSGSSNKRRCVTAGRRMAIDCLEARELKTGGLPGLAMDLPIMAMAEQHAEVAITQTLDSAAAASAVVSQGQSVDSNIVTQNSAGPTKFCNDATDAVFSALDADEFIGHPTEMSGLNSVTDEKVKDAAPADCDELMGMLMMAMAMPMAQRSMPDMPQMSYGAPMGLMQSTDNEVPIEPTQAENEMPEMPSVIVVYRDKPEEDPEEDEYIDPDLGDERLELLGMSNPRYDAVDRQWSQDVAWKGRLPEARCSPSAEDAGRVDENPIRAVRDLSLPIERDDSDGSESKQLALPKHVLASFHGRTVERSCLVEAFSGVMSMAATILLCVISGMSVV